MFNIAIGADSADLQRTARSALLQMLNTIVKRVTQAAVVGPFGEPGKQENFLSTVASLLLSPCISQITGSQRQLEVIGVVLILYAFASLGKHEAKLWEDVARGLW